MSKWVWGEVDLDAHQFKAQIERLRLGTNTDADVDDNCGLSWLTLVSLFVVWFVFTFVVVFCALLIFGGST